MLTVHNEVDYLVKVMDLEVDGYIVKDSGFAELKKAGLIVSPVRCKWEPAEK